MGMGMGMGEGQRGGVERIPSRGCTVSTEPSAGVHLVNREVMI